MKANKTVVLTQVHIKITFVTLLKITLKLHTQALSAYRFITLVIESGTEIEMDPLFAEYSAKLFKDNYQRILEREVEKKDFYSQDDYPTLEERFRAMVMEAAQDTIKFGAYAGCVHYQDAANHEPRTAEKEQLALEVSDESKEIAESRSWWNG